MSMHISTSLQPMPVLPDMDETGSTTRHRALSHAEYLDTLHRPSVAEIRRISDIQIQKEQEITAKYHSAEEYDAAKLIQRAYRGHRERRQLDGLTLDPSSRWVEIIKEWRYRSATAPHLNSVPDGRNRSESAADLARLNWRRAKEIAEHAGAGESKTSLEAPTPTSSFGSFRRSKRSKSEPEPPNSMLMDLRYFLEMVDQKHRYGANLQVYHEEWQRSKTEQNFFYWLDHGAGKYEDLAPICPREKLEKERIRYLSREERRDYLVQVDDEGKLRWEKNGELITTSAELYRDSMRGIVPKDSDEPAFNDEDVKRQLSADAGFSSKLAAVGGMFRDAILADDPSDYAESTSSSSYSSSEEHTNRVALSPIPSEETPEQAAAHQRVTKDHTPGDGEHPSSSQEIQPLDKKKKKPIHVSPATILNSLLRASVRPGTWIYVSDTLGRLYIGIKSSGAFQHASFLSGARISSAGIIGIQNGQLEYLSPLSGHYRPTTKSFKVFVEGLKDQGVDMKKLKVSSAYRILLGMEYYGTSKKGLKKMLHPHGDAHRQERKKRKERQRDRAVKVDQQTLSTISRIAVGTPPSTGLSATEKVERNWRAEHGRQHGREHRRDLAGLMDDLHVRRLSDDGKSR